jgi:hypothetical protein
MASGPPSKPKYEETRIDLGDDLLEATRALEISPSSEPVESPRERVDVSPDKVSDDELRSAQILMGEGLWEQAKDALHRSIRHNPSNRVARKLLGQIQQRELEALLARPGITEPSNVAPEDVAEIIKQLDSDWSLGLDDLDVKSSSLLASGEVQRELARSIGRQASTMALRDRADLAVGFLQMEMPDVAVSLLEPAGGLSGGFLAVYCWALIRSGRAFECISVLELRLREEDLSAEVRTEWEYLLACARERLGEDALACELFRLLGNYRDSAGRYRRLKAALSARGRG